MGGLNPEWSVDIMPNLPLIDERWRLCECYLCQGNGTLTSADLTDNHPRSEAPELGFVVPAARPTSLRYHQSRRVSFAPSHLGDLTLGVETRTIRQL
ncbi:hypothetical protein ABT086_01590 [Streptomyces mirabilis]